MESIDVMKYKDFYLSSILLASGVTLLNLEKTDRGFVFFVFDISSERAESIISSHWARTLTLPTRDLIEAINELKTRLKSGI